ncbi:hypothetical protein LS71_008240 [Helicobacter jaachi]|uniref:Uncharacterized protein n=1 Tax=Helicobacter jaachi TaxID=1677920 RepID=A0A4U8T6Z9_9HELI|nr:hypothetical protein [Helicobacter jaachi]TLD95386.1 hypothetical protein LS71_008240 [Helicobacter jaachi]
MIDIDLLNDKADISGDSNIIENEVLFAISAYYHKKGQQRAKPYSNDEIIKELHQKLAFAMGFMELSHLKLNAK